MKSFLKKYWILIAVGAAALFLGYATNRMLALTPTEEIIVEMEALPAPSISKLSAPASVGQAIYESRCAACHDTGAAGSPKKGNALAWKSRMMKGKSVLLQHVIEGFNLMPPRGSCLECSDVDLDLALDYLIKQSKA